VKTNRFLLIFLIIILIIWIPIGVVNMIYDPGDIYLQGYLKYRYVDSYVKKLISSKVGLIQYGNERRVKFRLSSELDKYDCVILGSSHIMQLGTKRCIPQSLCNFCSSSVNLGVSGNSFEDLLIFSYNILENSKPPKKIIFGIDPWTFKWNMDVRYKLYANYIEMMKRKISFNYPGTLEPYASQLLSNIINLEYFIESLKKAIKDDFQVIKVQNIEEVQDFNYDEGYLEHVTLSDGSHVYSSNYIKSNRTSESYMANGDYKLTDVYYDKDVLDIFKKLIELYRENGFQVYIHLSPYHQTVFRSGNEKNYRYLLEVENVVMSMSREMNIPVYGSFDPKKIGCLPDEFFDFMHPNRFCFDKIIFRS
jgi:hypothetical protein